MDNLIDDIHNIISDYHCDSESGFIMTQHHIEEWVNQFDIGDREFVLSELLHILNSGIYISKERALKLLLTAVKNLTKMLKYSSVEEFLNETVFLNLQAKGKSQNALLELLDAVLQDEYNIKLSECGVFTEKNYVYLDDILATGKTIVGDCREWFSKDNNLTKCEEAKTTFSVVTLCMHSWSESRIQWSLKKHFDNDYFTSSKFRCLTFNRIGDNIKDYNSTLNVALPKRPCKEGEDYLSTLVNATEYGDRAFRPNDMPNPETLFSNDINRNRFERILLLKGIEILSKFIDKEKSLNHRPLGKTYPRYKTLGTGTLFFTWRNISNTCPIVFWWDVVAHNWKGLFPLENRGN